MPIFQRAGSVRQAGAQGIPRSISGEKRLLTPPMAQRIGHWLLEKLMPYVRNPRTHSDAQVAQIAASIAEFAQCVRSLEGTHLVQATARGSVSIRFSFVID